MAVILAINDCAIWKISNIFDNDLLKFTLEFCFVKDPPTATFRLHYRLVFFLHPRLGKLRRYPL